MKYVLSKKDLVEAIKNFIIKETQSDMDLSSNEVKIISELGVIDENVPCRVEVKLIF